AEEVAAALGVRLPTTGAGSVAVSPAAKRTRSVRLVLMAATLGIAVAGGLGISRALRPAPAAGTSEAAPLAARPSIALAPLANLGGLPGEAWLATALSEALAAELSAGEKLRVVSGVRAMSGAEHAV